MVKDKWTKLQYRVLKLELLGLLVIIGRTQLQMIVDIPTTMAQYNPPGLLIAPNVIRPLINKKFITADSLDSYIMNLLLVGDLG